MFFFFIGTKAQYVKTAPVLLELNKRNIEYILIDSGQHAQLSKKFRKSFGIKEPDIQLREGKQDIATFLSAFFWITSFFLKGLFLKNRVSREIFKNKKGICVIHGDTPTTLLSIFLAKRVGLKVAHLESGLRSFNLLHPFPEEIIRIISMKFSDYLFSSHYTYSENLSKIKCKGEVIQISENTNLDSTRYAIAKKRGGYKGIKRPYALVSIHRFESIYSGKRLKFIVNLIINISKTISILFCVHPPTRIRLEKYGLYGLLNNKNNIILKPLINYEDFLQNQLHAEFIITDGGSIQEESFYFGIPCLLLRMKSERIDGLGENVVLSGFDEERINSFLNNYSQLRRKNRLDSKNHPSSEIVDALLKLHMVA